MKKSGFTRGAIVAVSILNGLVLLIIGVLIYKLALPKQALPVLQPKLDLSSPTAPRVLVAPPDPATATRAPMALPPTIVGTRIPINPPSTSPTATTTPVPFNVNTPPSTPNMPQIPKTEYIHPTYEPTTQPCQNCHSQIRGDMKK